MSTDLHTYGESPTGTNWKARLSEANDAIGAARDAIANTWPGTRARVDAADDLTFWLQQKAHVETWLKELAR